MYIAYGVAGAKLCLPMYGRGSIRAGTPKQAGWEFRA